MIICDYVLSFFYLKIKHSRQIIYCVLAGVEGFEPSKCRNQNPVPYHLATPQFVGWKMGFEPMASGATNQRSNQLSYIHRFS